MRADTGPIAPAAIAARTRDAGTGRRAGARGLRPLDAAALGRERAAATATGLPEGMGRWQLLACLRTAAPALGLSPPMVALVTRLVELTWDADWEAGAEPVVPVPLLEIAEALGRSERQVRSLEAALASRGLLVFRDSGNHHRRGRRDARTGRLLWASGPSLAPLRARAAEIRAVAAEVRAGQAEARRLRLGIQGLRRRIRAGLAALGAAGAGLAAAFAAEPDRAGAGTPLAELRARHGALAALAARVEAGLLADAAPGGTAGQPEVSGRHEFNDTTNPSVNGSCGARRDERPATGRQGRTRTEVPVTPALARAAAGPMLRALLPAGPVGWADLADAAGRLLPFVGIGPAQWQGLAAEMGRERAALCLLLLERGLGREEGGRAPPVARPGGWLEALRRRAADGRFDLMGAVRAAAARGRAG